jgi:hypothetical protein
MNYEVTAKRGEGVLGDARQPPMQGRSIGISLTAIYSMPIEILAA